MPGLRFFLVKTASGGYRIRGKNGRFIPEPDEKPYGLSSKNWRILRKWRTEYSSKKVDELRLLEKIREELKESSRGIRRIKKPVPSTKKEKRNLKSYLRFQIVLFKYDAKKDETPLYAFIQGVLNEDGYIKLKYLAYAPYGIVYGNAYERTENISMADGVDIARVLKKDGYKVKASNAYYKVYNNITHRTYKSLPFNPLKKRF